MKNSYFNRTPLYLFTFDREKRRTGVAVIDLLPPDMGKGSRRGDFQELRRGPFLRVDINLSQLHQQGRPQRIRLQLPILHHDRSNDRNLAHLYLAKAS